jgi:hypothetical protein
LIVWLYNNTARSVFAAVICHDTANVSEFLFPNLGSHYDPVLFGLVAAIVATTVTVRGVRERSPTIAINAELPRPSRDETPSVRMLESAMLSSGRLSGAGQALRTMTDQEGLSVREAVNQSAVSC